MNLLFPLSISASTVVLVLLVQKYRAADDAVLRVSYALVSSLLALAVLEHWFMVLPLPSEKLWQWGMGRARRSGLLPYGSPEDAATPSRSNSI